MKILNSLKAWGVGTGGGAAGAEKLQPPSFWSRLSSTEGMTAGSWHFLGICALGRWVGEGRLTLVPAAAAMNCGPGTGLHTLPASYYFHLTILLENKS